MAWAHHPPKLHSAVQQERYLRIVRTDLDVGAKSTGAVHAPAPVLFPRPLGGFAGTPCCCPPTHPNYFYGLWMSRLQGVHSTVSNGPISAPLQQSKNLECNQRCASHQPCDRQLSAKKPAACTFIVAPDLHLSPVLRCIVRRRSAAWVVICKCLNQIDLSQGLRIHCNVYTTTSLLQSCPSGIPRNANARLSGFL